MICAILRPLVDVREEELPAFLWSFAWFFCLLFAYYIVRPIRETLASSVASEHMGQLFFTVFVVMLIAVPVYSFLVARLGRRKFVPIVYRFFSAWLFLFSYLSFRSPEPTFAVGCVYFVWVSVFNLFVVSVFWSVLADSFSSASGKRLFGFIAAGGSLGGLCSSLLVGVFAEEVGVAALLMVPALVLEGSLYCFRRLDRQSARLSVPASIETAGFETAGFETAGFETAGFEAESEPKKDEPTGGGIFDGMIRAFSSWYLFGICMFLLLGKFCATTVYLKQLEVVKAEVQTTEEKTALFAKENSAVQVLTMVFQAALAGHIMRYLGLPFALALLPAVMVVALIYLAGSPSLLAVFVIQVMQRSMAYGLAEPAKAVLFTVVSREDKYKTKSFVDTVIFRGGDLVASNLERFLASAAKVMIPVTIVWLAISWVLGLQQKKLADSQSQ